MTAVGVEVVKSGNPASGINVAADGSVSIVVLSRRVLRANADFSIEYGLETGASYSFVGANIADSVNGAPAVKITRGTNGNGLELVSDPTIGTTPGNMVILRTINSPLWGTNGIAGYIDSAANISIRTWLNVSNTITDSAPLNGINFRISPPDTLQDDGAANAAGTAQFMIGAWSDGAATGYAIFARSNANAAQCYVGANRSGVWTFKVGETGETRFGPLAGPSVNIAPVTGLVSISQAGAGAFAPIGFTATNLSAGTAAEARYTAVNDASKTWIMQLLGSGVTGTYGGITKANATFLYSSSDDYAMLATTNFHILVGTTTLFSCEATKLAFFGVTRVVKQTSGANLTNSVTSGGTDDTVSNVTAADVDTSAAKLTDTRNAIYQLARKLKQINDGLRLYGLYT